MLLPIADAAEQDGFGALLLLVVVALMLPGLLLPLRRPRSRRSLGRIGIIEAVMVGLTAFLFWRDNGDYLPVFMAGLSVTLCPVLFLGCLGRMGFDAVRRRRA